ncbi:MAG: PAS domain-containing protein [Deltaproteobacteria bacterium]|nr:PAS domain-containing protein [Deltaproteobacteria bacterium]
MKTKRIMIACGALLFVAFSLFVGFYQGHLYDRAMVQIRDHANIVASSLWTFEKASPTAYLTLAAKANDYDRIVVRNDQGDIFLDIPGPRPILSDRVLRSVNLIPLYWLETAVEFEGKRIGTIFALWPCRAIYLHFYILFCILLIMPGIWFFLKLLDSNRTLESRVRERTAELERENMERQRAEEGLRKYERIVSVSQDLMALVRRGYVYEAVNESFLKAHRKTNDQIVGRTIPEVLGPVFMEKIQQRIDRAFSGQTVRYQEQLDLAGQGPRIVDVTYFPVFDDQGNVEGVVLNARDITETRKLEEQLMQSQRIESIGTLAGGVAHEINNPINGIMNYAQLILDSLDKGNPAGTFAQEILHETQRIAKIVRNLLTFARHEKQSHSPARLSDIVSAVLSLIQTVMRHDQITLEVVIPEDLPKFKCRSQQIQQVLMNLLTNARDSLNERYPGFSPDKKIRLVAELIHKEGRRYIRTTVEDHGVGIPLEIRDRIFDPFFTTKPKETGTGLGLSISYGIVRDHGGELIVESEPGQYARFHMDLCVDNGWALPEKEKNSNGK